MKVKEFISQLKAYNQEAEILVSCDEELNTIYSDVQSSYLTGEDDNDTTKVVIWGSSGSETEDGVWGGE
jgi:hypothetical protein